ncbi:MAG: pantoate--beta-alanine ligase [Actinotalea sp.]|nr:pantoate--beta-alanine ligase [Actinotalea sp.]
MSPAPLLVRSRAALADALAAPHGRRAVVMTMGALHDGHLSLVQAARELGDQVVVTIFVNPLQFGPQEDLDRYPRDLEGDLARLTQAGADIVFAPDVAVMYPDGEPVVRVAAGPISDRLEGAHRPGHFDGMLTVVLKLLHLVRPDVALFGQKDAQQLMAVRRMVADLDLDVEVVAGATVRDVDGVALSSRNAFLGTEDRRAARALPAALRAAEASARAGGTADEVRAAAQALVAAEPGIVVDYVALVDPATAEDVRSDHGGAALLALAARVGSTRLIDNTTVQLVGVLAQAPEVGQR